MISDDDRVAPTWSGILWSRFHSIAPMTAETLMFGAANSLDDSVLEEYVASEVGDRAANPAQTLSDLCGLIRGAIGYGVSRGWNVDGAFEAFIKDEETNMERYL